MAETIPSIYDYCDRWCERCDFTDKCLVYEGISSFSSSTDSENKFQTAFSQVSTTLKKTVQLLRASAEKYQVELDNLSPLDEERMRAQMKATDAYVRSHPVIELCNQYASAAHQLITNKRFWKKMLGELVQQGQLGMANATQLEARAQVIKHARESINWYLFLIALKFSRALSSRIESCGMEDEIQNHSNGCAKVAMNSVTRSIGAWNDLLELAPDDDRVLNILVILSRIDNAAKKEFPNAMQFIRPGFDE